MTNVVYERRDYYRISGSATSARGRTIVEEINYDALTDYLDTIHDIMLEYSSPQMRMKMIPDPPKHAIVASIKTSSRIEDMPWTGAMGLVASERLCQLFIDVQGNNIKLIKVALYKDNAIWTPPNLQLSYYIVIPLSIVECHSERHSVWPVIDGKRARRMSEFEIDSRRVPPNQHLFDPLGYEGWHLCSHVLRERIEEAGLTGVSFTKTSSRVEW